MPVAETREMYKLDPVISLPAHIDLPSTTGPNSMYRLPPYFDLRLDQSGEGQAISAVPGESRKGGEEAVLQQLSVRQEAVLTRLGLLQQQLQELRAAKHIQLEAGVEDELKAEVGSNQTTNITAVPQLKGGGVCHDVVVSAHPSRPPYSLPVLAAALRSAGYTVHCSARLHSTLAQSDVPASLSVQFNSSNSDCGGGRADHKLVFTVLWSNVEQPTLMVNPLQQCVVQGEGNIVRYISRLFPASSCYHYEASPSLVAVARTDQMLDLCTEALRATGLQMQQRRGGGDNGGSEGVEAAQVTKRFFAALAKHLPGSPPAAVFGGPVGNLIVWSTVRQLTTADAFTIPAALKTWMAAADTTFTLGLENSSSHGSNYATQSLASESSFVLNGGLSVYNKYVFAGAKKLIDVPASSVYNNSGCRQEVRVNRTGDNINSAAAEPPGKAPDKPSTISEVTHNSSTTSKTIAKSASEAVSTVVDCSAVAERSLVCRTGLEACLQRLDIEYQLREHDAVMTVEDLINNVVGMPGLHMKNLFLKDKKKRLYLLAARHDAQVRLNDVAKRLGCKDLRFADPNVLYATLGIHPGHVTVFALINDTEHKVQLVLDAEVLQVPERYVNFHPMVNTATLGVRAQDLEKFLTHTGHRNSCCLFKMDTLE